MRSLVINKTKLVKFYKENKKKIVSCQGVRTDRFICISTVLILSVSDMNKYLSQNGISEES